MAKGSAQLIGLESLYKDLQKMGAAGEKAQDKALKAGGNVFLKLALQNVTRSDRNSAHLKDSIKVSPVKIADDGEKYVSVGTYLGRGKYRNGVYWGHIIEGGHILKSPKGKVYGYVSARPFMQPAYEAGLNEATKVVGDIIFKAMGL